MGDVEGGYFVGEVIDGDIEIGVVMVVGYVDVYGIGCCVVVFVGYVVEFVDFFEGVVVLWEKEKVMYCVVGDEYVDVVV